jgi:thiamine-phosphate diphosphorylase
VSGLPPRGSDRPGGSDPSGDPDAAEAAVRPSDPGRDLGRNPASLSLARRLRLIVITDRALAHPHSVEEAVTLALEAGALAIQLREKQWGVGRTLPQAVALRRLCEEHGALFFVNDRLDLALATGAHGVHLGPDDLPVRAVRRVAPEGFLIGYSTDDPDQARRAVEEGADYIGCGTVWPTGSKADAGEPIGPEGLSRVARAVEVPVVGIGGVTPERVGSLGDTGAAGVAVMGAVMGATDPGTAVRDLLEGFGSGP